MARSSIAEDSGILSLDVAAPWFVADALQDPTEYRSFYVTKGLGSGGTYGLAIWHITLCLINKRSKFSWSIAPTYQQVADTLIPTFTTVLNEVFGFEESVDYEVIGSSRPRIILKPTGQEIHFKSANRPERMVGPSISHISMTEPGLCPTLAFEKSNARLRCPRAIRLQRFYEGTPEGLENHWANIANFDEGINEALNAVRYTVWTEDNRHLKPSYIENLIATYSYDPAKQESYTRGTFMPFTKGSAYWEFVHSRNVTLNVKPDVNLPLIMSWDFGVNPIAWVAIQRQKHETRFKHRYDRFVALAEGSGAARGVLDACAEFIKAFDPVIYRDTPIHVDGGQDGYNGHWLSPSSSYDQIYQVLSKYYRNVQIVASRSAPQIKDRLNKVAALMCYERYVVAAWCKNLIASHTNSSLKQGTWEFEKKQGNDKSGHFKDPTHFADAACAPLFRLTKDEDLISPETRKTFGTNSP